MLNMDELNKVAKSSKAQDGPWKWWKGEMCKKSAVRRLYKQIAKGGDPVAMQALAKAVEIDNQDHGLLEHEAQAGLREYGQSVRDRASRRTTTPPECPQEAQAAPGSTLPTEAEREARRKGIAKRRAKCDSSLDHDGFVAAVIEQEFGPGLTLEALDREQFAQMGAALAANRFDWETAARIPSPDESETQA
jgi:hypothetical protein